MTIEAVQKAESLRSILDIAWFGPEPEFMPMDGRYVCSVEDGETVRMLIDTGQLPMPGAIPGDRFLSLREMVEFQIRRLIEQRG